MFELKPFKAEDADLLCPTSIDESLHDDPEYCRRWALVNEKNGPAYTAYYKGKPIGAAGIRLLKQNTGLVWAVFSPELKQLRKSFLKTILVMMDILVKEFELTRLVTDSRKGFEASQTLIRHLGFKKLEEETDTQYFYEYVGV